MSYKNLLVTSLLSFTTLQAADVPMPPMPPMLPAKAKSSASASQSIDACKLLPPMVIHLPPPMEAELTNCKNSLFLPKKELVESNLSKMLKKKVTVSKIEIVPKFNQLYKITHSEGVILTNKTVDAFIKQ